jgi:hypothetical protein
VRSVKGLPLRACLSWCKQPTATMMNLRCAQGIKIRLRHGDRKPHRPSAKREYTHRTLAEPLSETSVSFFTIWRHGVNDQQFDLHMEALERIRCGIIDVETAVQNIKVELPSASDNSVSPKLSAAVCRKCTGDQFRCDSCEMGSNFNPSHSTSGK